MLVDFIPNDGSSNGKIGTYKFYECTFTASNFGHSSDNKNQVMSGSAGSTQSQDKITSKDKFNQKADMTNSPKSTRNLSINDNDKSQTSQPSDEASQPSDEGNK